MASAVLPTCSADEEGPERWREGAGAEGLRGQGLPRWPAHRRREGRAVGLSGPPRHHLSPTCGTEHMACLGTRMDAQ